MLSVDLDSDPRLPLILGALGHRSLLILLLAPFGVKGVGVVLLGGCVYVGPLGQVKFMRGLTLPLFHKNKN